MTGSGEASNTSGSSPSRLSAGGVGLWGDFIAAITNVAPSTSIALTLGAIIGVSGMAAPSIMWIVGLAMLCIAVAYDRLNFWAPNAAAQAMWIARTVGPIVGLAMGFIVLFMTIIANIANTTLFGPYFLGIVWPDQAGNPLLQFICSAVATGLVLAIAIAGIRAAIRFQAYVVWVEYVIIVAFVVLLFHAELTGQPGSQVPNLAWLLPSTAPSPSDLVAGIVLAVFMFGGWECAVYLAEEQHNPKSHPGLAGVISVVFCTIWYIILCMAVQAIAPSSELVKHQANIVAYTASLVAPTPWNYLVSLAVLSSVVAVVQSQLQNFSRMAYGLAREGLLPSWLTNLSSRQTPAIGLALAAVLPMAMLVIYLSNNSAANILTLVSGSAGILYIFLYVGAALACTWYFRRTLTNGLSQFLFAGVLPLVGAGVLLFALVSAIPTTAVGTLIPAAVFVVIGLPLAWLIRGITRAPFFSWKPMAADRDDTGRTNSLRETEDGTAG